MTTFLLIRHAAHGLLGLTIVGRQDGIHLSADGERQAVMLAQRLAKTPVRAIYTSPLERARETAAPIARSLALSVQVAEELNELDFGDWTGRSLEELDRLDEWHRFNVFRSGTRAPNGELMLEAQARIVALMERLRVRHSSGQVALVTHGDVIRSALLHYLGMPIDLFQRIEISPASVSAVVLEAHGPRVVYMNEMPDTSGQ